MTSRILNASYTTANLNFVRILLIVYTVLSYKSISLIKVYLYFTFYFIVWPESQSTSLPYSGDKAALVATLAEH